MSAILAEKFVRDAREVNMWYRLRRHPFAVKARFGHCLVLTYSLPADVLSALLPPGLELETVGERNELGILAVAMVQTQRLRPVGFPRCLGQDFFLGGYRIFARFPCGKRTLRGLRILRSDTDRPLMKFAGNLLTHYNYHRATVRMETEAGRLLVRIASREAEADLEVVADLTSVPASLPAGSCFTSERHAARFAGPLPYTFDYEPETDSVIVIRAVRHHWRPQLIDVDVRKNLFLLQGPFAGVPARLAAAFHLCGIDYRWERGFRVPLRGVNR